MTTWNTPATDEMLHTTTVALEEKGIYSIIVETEEQAREEALKLIPEKSEVMTTSSITLEQTGIANEINTSGKYDSIRAKLFTMDRTTQGREMQKLGSAPEWVIGSVHALTQDGSFIIASKTGSQLSPEAYAAAHVLFVIGTQKIVQNIDAGLKRLYEYTLPLESERANKAYNITTGSEVAKLLIIHHEIIPGRINVILIKKNIGF